MSKHSRSAKRSRKRGRPHASDWLPSGAAKRGRRWVIPVILAMSAIGLTVVWTLRDQQKPRVSSSPPPLPVVAKHVEVMLNSQAQKMPQSVQEIQQEELALAEALVQDFPKSDVSLALLAGVYQSHGDTAQAEKLWKQAVALNPKRTDLYTKIGQTAQGKDKLEEAISWWRQGVSANPKAGGLRWMIASALVTQGHLETTLELLEAESMITPGAARNDYLMGQVHLKQRAYEKAEAAYRKAIEINPEYYNAYYGLGMVYTRMKRATEARTAMAEFRQLKTKAAEDQQIMIDEIPHAKRRIAASYAQAYKLYDPKQQAEMGARLLGRALELDARNAKFWEKMAGHNYVNGRYEQAIRLFEEAEKRAPEKPIYPINIGKLYAQMNRIDQARAALQRAVAHFPDSSLAHVELAQHYLKSQTHGAEALTLMKKAAAMSPTAHHYYLLTWAYDVNGDPKNAVVAIQKALALEPMNPQYRSTYERIRSRR